MSKLNLHSKGMNLIIDQCVATKSQTLGKTKKNQAATQRYNNNNQGHQ